MREKKMIFRRKKKKKTISDKKRITALILCMFFGWFGFHRFYVNKFATGVLMMFTMGGFGMWILVDLILLLSERFKDSDDYIVTTWGW